jgi:hypothetical protein
VLPTHAAHQAVPLSRETLLAAVHLTVVGAPATGVQETACSTFRGKGGKVATGASKNFNRVVQQTGAHGGSARRAPAGLLPTGVGVSTPGSVMHAGTCSVKPLIGGESVTPVLLLQQPTATAGWVGREGSMQAR